MSITPSNQPEAPSNEVRANELRSAFFQNMGKALQNLNEINMLYPGTLTPEDIDGLASIARRLSPTLPFFPHVSSNTPLTIGG